jgi:TonB family protein
MSRSIIQHNQVDAAVSNLNNTEPPILLIGDHHALVDPLIKLLARSLSANFHYPKIEGIFGARGRVLVELVLHPEGYFSDVQIVQSSDIQDFNTAALYAVNMAPTVVGVNKFLPKAKRFVVGFIFE